MKALVLSGGGAGGAFQVGVLKEIWGISDFQTIYGTSVGALNGTALKHLSIQELEQMWLGIKGRSDVLSINPLFYLGFADGKYSSKKLGKILDGILQKPVVHDVNVKVSAVNYANSDIVYTSYGEKNFRDMVMASAAIPFHMDAVNGFIDGGVRDHTPIEQAILDGHTDITVICTNPINRSERERNFKKKWPYAISIGLRATDILQSEILYGDFESFFDQDDPVNMTVFAPHKRIIDTFEYEPQKIRAAIAQGQSIVPQYIRKIYK